MSRDSHFSGHFNTINLLMIFEFNLITTRDLTENPDFPLRTGSGLKPFSLLTGLFRSPTYLRGPGSECGMT